LNELGTQHKTYRSIFLHKRAEDRVSQQGFVTRKLKQTLLVTTQKLPVETSMKIKLLEGSTSSSLEIIVSKESNKRKDIQLNQLT
jgi:hypothetical protein